MKSEDLKMTWCSLAASNGLEESYWSNDKREEENNIEWKKKPKKKTNNNNSDLTRKCTIVVCTHMCVDVVVFFFWFFVAVLSSWSLLLSPRVLFLLCWAFFAVFSFFCEMLVREFSRLEVVFCCVCFFPLLTSSLLYSILLFSFLSSCSILLKLDGFFILSFIRILMDTGSFFKFQRIFLSVDRIDQFVSLLFRWFLLIWIFVSSFCYSLLVWWSFFFFAAWKWAFFTLISNIKIQITLATII